eukprot:UN05971
MPTISSVYKYFHQMYRYRVLFSIAQTNNSARKHFSHLSFFYCQ